MPYHNTPRGHRHGRSQKKNIAFAAWHAPLGGRAQEADLCRGQGFRRIAPPASPRFENRDVQGPAGPEGQEGNLTAAEGWRQYLPEFGPTSEIRRFPWRASQRLAETPWFSCLKKKAADVHGRFSAPSDSAPDLQHHRLFYSRRFPPPSPHPASAHLWHPSPRDPL